MGAGIIAGYLAIAKEKTPIVAAVSLANHFDAEAATTYLSKHLYGLYDYGLGQFCRMNSRQFFKDYDALVKEEGAPSAYDENERVKNISFDFTSIIAKRIGFKNLKDYFRECSVTHRMD